MPLDQAERARQAAKYQEIMKKHKPRPPTLQNFVVAFIVGGAICVIGQAVLDFFTARGLAVDEASGPTLAVMIFLGALATGIGIYDELGEFSGAGAAVPITGFSNTIVAAAMDFKREGYVLGMGAKMFIVAGPVLVFGILAAVAVGMIHMLVT
ncbi:MAG: stage V sporulation protein AC [Firmicutes bacterium]|nr:stage V sporulation protein AC [Bacillota bacterium]